MDQLITSLRRDTNALLEKETCSITISIGLHSAITSQANATTYDTWTYYDNQLPLLTGAIWMHRVL